MVLEGLEFDHRTSGSLYMLTVTEHWHIAQWKTVFCLLSRPIMKHLIFFFPQSINLKQCLVISDRYSQLTDGYSVKAVMTGVTGGLLLEFFFFFNITKPPLLHYAPPQSVSAMDTSSGSFVDKGICQMGSNKLFRILRWKEGKGTEAFDCRPCVSWQRLWKIRVNTACLPQ